MADVGYFDSVSANLKTGVGAQVKGISEGVKANSDAGVSPSVNALNPCLLYTSIPILYRKKIWNSCIMANNLKIYY